MKPETCLRSFSSSWKTSFTNASLKNSSVFDILQHADIKDRWEEVLKGAGEAGKPDGRDDEMMKKDSDGLEESAFPQMEAGLFLK